MAQCRDAKPQDTASQTKTKYVLSGQPTGWAAMANVVREFDQEKVQDCKEDMDTLLVFAGLFSAVLSAFLIAAYPSVQPDRTDAILYALERIATHTAGYTFNGVTLTAINIPSSIPPSFVPASNDVRVNVLWFASLLISLITASFAILVKQWLRGFLAVDFPSPQARLRIRHFRAPEMDKWNVYEIAAVLPLLLQLALGLFFVGLCYFTASLDASVGWTTVPLVAGWAFCVFSATLLPIFFPRCPYRTTLLKTFVAKLYHAIVPCAQAWFSRLYHQKDDHTTRRGVLGGLLLWLRNLALIIIARASSNDELVIVNDAASDLDILLSVDVIQSNDELLGTTIREALQSAQSVDLEACRFLLAVLAIRLQTQAPTSLGSLRQWTPRLIDVRPLTRQGRAAIMGITVDIANQLEISSHSGQVSSDTQRSISWTFSILASLAACGSLSPESHRFLQDCLRLSGAELCYDLVRPIYGGQDLVGKTDPTNMLRALTTLVPEVDVDIQAWLRCFSGVVNAQLDHSHEGGPRNAPAILPWGRDEMGQLLWFQIFTLDPSPNNSMSLAIEFLLQAACGAFRQARRSGTPEPRDTHHAIRLALFLMGKSRSYGLFMVDIRRRLRDLLCTALSDPALTSSLMDTLLSAQHKWVSHGVRHTADDVILQGEPLRNLLGFVQQQISEKSPTLDELARLCFLCIVLVDPVPNALLDANLKVWTAIFSSITSHMAGHMQEHVAIRSQENRGIRHAFSLVAHFCLVAIDYVELGWGMTTDYAQWLKAFDPNNTVFSDELIDMLGQLNSFAQTYHTLDGHKSYRLRRLHRLRDLRSAGGGSPPALHSEPGSENPAGTQAGLYMTSDPHTRTFESLSSAEDPLIPVAALTRDRINFRT